MIVIMSLLSVIEHFLFLAFVIMLTYFLSDTAFLITSLAELYMPFKHFLNFFLESNHNDHTATHHADTHLMLNNTDNLLTTRSSNSIHKNITRSDHNLTDYYYDIFKYLEHFLITLAISFTYFIKETIYNGDDWWLNFFI